MLHGSGKTFLCLFRIFFSSFGSLVFCLSVYRSVLTPLQKSRIQETLNLLMCAPRPYRTETERRTKRRKKEEKCNESGVRCHVSHVMCCVSPVTCHMSPVTNANKLKMQTSHQDKKILKSIEKCQY